MEFHAFAQLQLDGLVIQTLPACRQTGHATLIAHPIAVDQTFPQVGEKHAFPDVGLFVPDIHRVVVGDLLNGNGDCAALGLCERQPRHSQRAGSGPQKSKSVAAVNKHEANLCR